MPKKTKPSPALSTAPSETAPDAPAKTRPARKSAAPAKRPARKSAAKNAGAAKKSSPKRAAKKSTAPVPSDAEIATRAYFIAERRHQKGIGGDSAHDWLEARRQLEEEAAPADK